MCVSFLFQLVAPKNSIPALIEESLVGQLNNHIEYYRSYPFTVNKVCNLPEVVDKYTPKDLGEQIFKFDTRLSDLLFGADLADVFIFSYYSLAIIFFYFEIVLIVFYLISFYL